MLLPIIKLQWNLDNELIVILATLLFCGITFGSLIGGYISDVLGRKKTLIIVSFFMFFFGFLSCFSQKFLMFSITRILNGIVIGALFPLGSTFIAEMSPSNMRGRLMTFLRLYFSFGSLFACCLAYIFLKSLTEGNWRLMMLFSSIPSLFSFILSLKFLNESIIYDIINGDHYNAIKTCDKIGRMNLGVLYQDINEIEKEIILTSVQTNFAKKSKINLLFKIIQGELGLITFKLSMIWFSVGFCYYGLIYIIPFILEYYQLSSEKHKNLNFLNLAGPFVGEIPSCLISMYLIDFKQFGRKNSLLICFSINSILFFAIFCFCDSQSFTIWISITMFFTKTSICFLYPLTAEYYNTKIRSSGIGFTSSLSRIAGVLMPNIINQLFSMNYLGPFLLFELLSIFAGLFVFFLPYDTTGMDLDLLSTTID